MAYTNQQYIAQAKLQHAIGQANHDGLCVVCRKNQRSRWADTNVLRMTCGDNKCFMEWLPVKGLAQSQTSDTAQ